MRKHTKLLALILALMAATTLIMACDESENNDTSPKTDISDIILENDSTEENTVETTTEVLEDTTEETETETDFEIDINLDDIIIAGVTPEFKETMDSYEKFFDEYIAFMQKYNSSDDTSAMMGDYIAYLQQYAETMQKIDEIDETELSDADYAYYVVVQARISKKLLEMDTAQPNETDSTEPNEDKEHEETTTAGTSSNPTGKNEETQSPSNNNTNKEPVDRKQEAVELAEEWSADSDSSRDWLRSCLLDWGFTESETQYAIDNCNVNWEQCALQCVNNFHYADEEFLVPNELRTDLETCEFTKSEIEYAITHCDYDWNEHALNIVNDYRFSGTTRDEITSELVDEYGFTQDQAEYAILNSSFNFGWLAEDYLWKYIEEYNDVPSRDDCYSELLRLGFTESEIEYALSGFEFDEPESEEEN